MGNFVTLLETRLGKALADGLLLVVGLGVVAWAVHAFLVDFAIPIARLAGNAIGPSAHASKSETLISIARVGVTTLFAAATLLLLRSLGQRWIQKEKAIRDEALGLLDRIRHATEDIRISTQMGQTRLSEETKRSEELLEGKRQEILRLGGKLVSQTERLVPLFAAAENRLTALSEKEQVLHSEMHDGHDGTSGHILQLDPSIAGRARASSSLSASGAA